MRLIHALSLHSVPTTFETPYHRNARKQGAKDRETSSAAASTQISSARSDRRAVAAMGGWCCCCWCHGTKDVSYGERCVWHRGWDIVTWLGGNILWARGWKTGRWWGSKSTMSGAWIPQLLRRFGGLRSTWTRRALPPHRVGLPQFEDRHERARLARSNSSEGSIWSCLCGTVEHILYLSPLCVYFPQLENALLFIFNLCCNSHLVFFKIKTR